MNLEAFALESEMRSKADMSDAGGEVRFVPIADIQGIWRKSSTDCAH
jgi:hypothetical protein